MKITAVGVLVSVLLLVTHGLVFAGVVSAEWMFAFSIGVTIAVVLGCFYAKLKTEHDKNRR